MVCELIYSIQALRKHQNGENSSLSPVYKASLFSPFIWYKYAKGMDR